MRYRHYFKSFCIERAHRGRRRERAGPKKDGTSGEARLLPPPPPTRSCGDRRRNRSSRSGGLLSPGLEGPLETDHGIHRRPVPRGPLTPPPRMTPPGVLAPAGAERPGIRGTKDGPGILTGPQATNGSPPFSPIMGRPARSQDCMPPPTLIASQPTWFSQAAACAERPPRRQIT
jgi:hypothetical protein